MSLSSSPRSSIRAAAGFVLIASTLVAGAAMAEDPATTSIETQRQTRPVAPGVTLDSFDRWGETGWLRTDALTVDLDSGATVDYVSPGTVASNAPLTEQVEAEPETVAAINGDFFDISDTGAPLGIGVSDTELVKSANPGRENAMTIDPKGVGHILQVGFEGSLTAAGKEHELAALNTNVLEKDAIGEYTSLWGSGNRTRPVSGAASTCEVAVKDSVVTTVSATPGTQPVPHGAYVLLGREAGATTLCALKAGESVEVEYSPRTSDDSKIDTALGGSQLLVVDGEVQQHPDDAPASRSAVGFSADGATMYLLTVDGKQADSVGITVSAMAEMMKELGAHSALNIDGGGSSTMLARDPGTDDLEIVNGPSDGVERPVANGLAVSVPNGSGKASGYAVETAMDALDAPGDAPMGGGRPDRVFPGLSRKLTATPYDETFAPASGDPQWRTEDRRTGTVDRAGLFTARHSGSASVTASRGRATGATALDVLGKLDRIDSAQDRVGLADLKAEGSFGIVGYDDAGFTAPIEPRDIRLSYDRSLLSVKPTAEGFSVTAKKASAATTITARVGRLETPIPVTVGLTKGSVASFEDASGWKFSAARATGSLAPAEGHDGGGLAIDYDFTTSTATRAAYAAPPAPVAIAGQPQSFGMWIKGQGNGEWPSLQFRDGAGASLVLRGDYVTWNDWQYVEMAVPPGTVYPLTFDRFYVAETDPTASYDAGIVVDSIEANVPPDIEVPEEPTVVDPTIRSDVGGTDWDFAVMSDSQFVARDPESDIVTSARRTLQEIRKATPDFLLINGDLVDEGSPEDLAFARSVIEDELGDSIPWRYIPGNHEVMGGEINNFVQEFGEAFRTFDHRGTRFITLDTSGLSIHSGGFAQMTMLRKQLDTAAKDRKVRSVVVVEHVPTRDPMPAAASQLTDRKDAEIVEKWLTDFGVSTGKGTGFVGSHVGMFSAAHVDGVPYVINGNSGKSPASAPEDGGFVGWTQFGVDQPSSKDIRRRQTDPYGLDPSDWLTAATRAQIDTLSVTAPSSLKAGASAKASASFTQQDRVVPVGYPVSADWSASKGVHIGSEKPRGRKFAAWFDPATERLSAIRPGHITLTVTVNGVRGSAAIAVTR